MKTLPIDHGVYVIYDFNNKVVYVGKTWDNGGRGAIYGASNR